MFDTKSSESESFKCRGVHDECPSYDACFVDGIARSLWWVSIIWCDSILFMLGIHYTLRVPSTQTPRKDSWYHYDRLNTVHEILILIKWWKISPLARLQVRARKIWIMRIVDFGQFWSIFAKKCFSFYDGKIFPSMGNFWNFQGSISTGRGTFEPKTHPSSPL